MSEILENRLICQLENGIMLFEKDAIEVENTTEDGKTEKLILILTVLPLLTWYDRKNEIFYDFHSVFEREIHDTVGKSIEKRISETFKIVDFADNVKYLGNYKELGLE